MTHPRSLSALPNSLPLATRGALTLAVLCALLLVAARPAHAQTESVLYTFCSIGAPQYCYDGAQPTGNLVLDSHGNLYGTTTWGGSEVAGGTVFKVTPSGTETVFYGFDGAAGGTDGFEPYLAGVVFDKAGNLYGTTFEGGVNHGGTVFELSPTGTETVLHSLAWSSGGAGPLAGVVLDKAGNIYGTTVEGGVGNNGNGYGTVFKITPKGTYTVLYNFSGLDGRNPFASVILDAADNIYGTTYYGGANNLGTVFKLTPTGTESVLHSFAGYPSDGAFPLTGVGLRKGILYGATLGGGSTRDGVVFKVVP